jgi:hypothetical protein
MTLRSARALFENLRIRQSLQALLAEMDRVVPEAAQKSRCLRRQRHVDQEPHSA